MSRLERLYARLPVTLQNAALQAESWRIERRRYGPEFRNFLAGYEERSDWPAGRLDAARDARLRAFLEHCESTVPYYRDQFRELGLNHRDFEGLADLKALPVLDKATVQERPAEFVSEAVPPGRRIVSHTSGTTGAGLRFATTREAVAEQWAVWWRYRRWYGIRRDTWCGYFGGRLIVPISQKQPPFWRIDRPGRRILFSGHHMGPATLAMYADELDTRRPPWLHGYPSLLALFATYLLEADRRPAYEVRWVTTGAENLLAHQTDVIRRAFGVAPRQHYGLAEGVANVSQHPDGTLRVDEEFAAVEFVPESDGSAHRIIGTNLSNLATPLLRYDTGDLADVADARGASGGRVVRSIDGRAEDYVVLADGTRIGRMDHVFKDATQVREAQIVQRAPGVIDLRLVPAEDYSDADERLLLDELRRRVGPDTVVQVEHRSSLPRSRTGKLRLVVRE